MNVEYEPDGGRFGYGFNFFCLNCHSYLGNSKEDEQLIHPTTKSAGFYWFKIVKVPIDCIHIGERYKMPIHRIEVTKILPNET